MLERVINYSVNISALTESSSPSHVIGDRNIFSIQFQKPSFAPTYIYLHIEAKVGKSSVVLKAMRGNIDLYDPCMLNAYYFPQRPNISCLLYWENLREVISVNIP